jgi:mannose-6-phosphate isomerase-like protein (cupin superfamily)
MYDKHPPLADKEGQAVVPLSRMNGAYLLNRSQGVQYWGPGGDRYEFLATGEKSGGTNFILLANIPIGGGPPPHAHKNEAEAFILLSGALVFTIGTERFEAPENSFVHIPQGVIHTYANTGVQPAKALVVFSPAGMEGWFRDVLHCIGNEGETPYAYTARELDLMIATGPKYGVTWG